MWLANRIRYGLQVLKIRLLQSQLTTLVLKFLNLTESQRVDRRLKKKGYGEIKRMRILSRYLGYRIYECQKENKERYMEIYNTISRVSESTGIPQWELRARIQREFGIEI